MNEIPSDVVQADVARALAEDVGSGDITAALLRESATAEARIITRDDGVLCGRPWAEETLRAVDERISSDWLCRDGDAIVAGQTLVMLTGPARGLLTAERTVMNFLQSLSGTATVSRRYAQAVAGSGATILDTRKTIPGLRLAQKYAVRCGGCENHRMGLFDAFLIKENHILACGGIPAAVARARDTAPDRPVEVEVENLEELEEAIRAGADRVMLDNFDLPGLAAAVRLTDGRLELEASGNMTLERLPEVAATGVNYISVGSLTKDVSALDLSMRLSDT